MATKMSFNNEATKNVFNDEATKNVFNDESWEPRQKRVARWLFA